MVVESRFSEVIEVLQYMPQNQHAQKLYCVVVDGVFVLVVTAVHCPCHLKQ